MPEPRRLDLVGGIGTRAALGHHGPMIRHLVTNPCRDACGTVATGEQIEGAPVFRCPGCESTWLDVPDEPVDDAGATTSRAPAPPHHA